MKALPWATGATDTLSSQLVYGTRVGHRPSKIHTHTHTPDKDTEALYNEDRGNMRGEEVHQGGVESLLKEDMLHCRTQEELQEKRCKTRQKQRGISNSAHFLPSSPSLPPLCLPPSSPQEERRGSAVR